MTDFDELIREIIDGGVDGICAPKGTYWTQPAEATSAVLTRETLEAAFDEVRYGPLPTVDDVLNEGLEPDMGIWSEHPAHVSQRFVDPGPMSFLSASDLYPVRDDRIDALRYAMYAQAIIRPADKIALITDI